MAKQINKSIIVSSWRNSTHNRRTGAGYGIRVSIYDVPLVQNWKKIKIGNTDHVLERGDKVFNTNCPEIRSFMIGRYFRQLGLLDWPKGRPHKYKLTNLGQGTFKLHR